MAILKLKDQEVEVADGSPTIDAAEELGVPFGCSAGVCGACEVEVLEGMDNLDELSDAELDMGLEDSNRLMCQCTIKKGTVVIKY